MSSATASRASRRELWIAAGLLLLAGCVMYVPHVVNGGFTVDDWGHAATGRYFREGILAHYWAFTDNRPVLVAYVPLTFILFGPHAWVHLAWSLLLAVGLSTALYTLLRRLGMASRHAGAIALLVLLFPWSDTARFWATASHINLGITFGIAGVLVAFRGFDQLEAGRSHRELALHLGAVALYALSVLTYEIAGVVLLFAGALYLTRAPWRVVRTRWAADSAVVLACLAWTGIRGDRERPPLDQMLEHAEQLAKGAATVFSQASMPFGTLDRRVAVALLATIALSALVVWSLQRADDDAKPVLRRWLVTLGCGLGVAIAGWILYIPADPYYQIDAPGVGNRTNVMAAIGVVTVVYSTFILAVTLLFRGTPNWKRSAAILSTVLAVLLAFGYAQDTRKDQQAWAHAADRSDQMLANIETALPDPPPESTIYTFNYPGSYAPGVIIFSFSWDLNGAIKLAYDDPTLIGYPILEGTTMRCGPDSVGPTGPEWTEPQNALYGKAFFVDVAGVRSESIDSRRQCLRAVSRFAPGPLIVVPGRS
jgi:hypothetical protein